MIRYAPMQRYSAGLVPSAAYLRYVSDYAYDLDAALRDGLSDAEYREILDLDSIDIEREGND
jgi:hypothetical protein